MNDFINRLIINDSQGIFLASILIFFGIQIFFYISLKLLRKTTHFIQNEEIRKVLNQNLHTLNWVFCYAISLKFSLSLLRDLDNRILESAGDFVGWLEAISFLLISYFAIILSEQWLIYLFRIVVQKNQKDEERFDPDGLSLIITLIRFVVWILGIIIVLKNFDIKGLDTLITSLGISGIAIAFALQNILSEIFASFSIYLDKPFIVGDYVEIGTDKGYIQRIGLRSTRIRSLSGEEIVVSNKELVGTRIHNFKLLKTRRVCFDLFLDLKTPLDKLKIVPDLVKNIVDNQPKTKFDRVSFMQIGEVKFRFEVVYNVISNDYKSFTTAQQNINYGILEELEKNGIDLIAPV